MAEVWKDVLEYEGRYKVSSLGRVKSLARTRKTKSGGVCPMPERFLSLTPFNGGYGAIGLYKDGKMRWMLVHQLVLETFIGPKPVGKEACHRNGDRSDSRLSNLYWGTHRENEADKDRHGNRPTARNGKHTRARLTYTQACEIRDMYATGTTSQNKLARMFGVPQETISRVVLNKSYK